MDGLRPIAMADLYDLVARHLTPRLTTRECAILHLALAGRSPAKIAAILLLPRARVTHHLVQILKKTGASSLTGLAHTLHQWERAASPDDTQKVDDGLQPERAEADPPVVVLLSLEPPAAASHAEPLPDLSPWILRCLRRRDTVLRWSQTEYLVVLSGASPRMSGPIVERLVGRLTRWMKESHSSYTLKATVASVAKATSPLSALHP